jgi:hypothetical protein
MIIQGDSFFVLEDLYGGEGLMIKPKKYQSSLSSPSSLSSSSISLTISASGVIITLLEKYDLFSIDQGLIALYYNHHQ